MTDHLTKKCHIIEYHILLMNDMPPLGFFFLKKKIKQKTSSYLSIETYV